MRARLPSLLVRSALTALAIVVPTGMTLAQTGYPLMVLNCETNYIASNDESRNSVAMITIEQPHTITNKELRLKFENSTLTLDDVAEDLPVEAISLERASEFPNIRDRWDDDDKPTLFMLDGVEYELSSPTSYTLISHGSDGSFKIKNPDIVMIEFLRVKQSSDGPEYRANWTGQCHFGPVIEAP